MTTVAIRTSETTITFRRSFSLGGMDRPQPAGTYRVVMDDDEVPGVSFVALRRIATLLHTPALATAGEGKSEVFHVGANELAAALDDDGRAPRDGYSSDGEADRKAT
jgi:hypothetical protein